MSQNNVRRSGPGLSRIAGLVVALIDTSARPGLRVCSTTLGRRPFGMMCGVLIRRARDDDVGAVAALYDQLAPQGGSRQRPATEAERATWPAMLASPSLTVMVADQDGRVIGTVALLLMPSLTDGCS